MARGTGLPCEDPHRNNNGGATSHPGLIPSRGRPRALTCRPDQSQTCGRTGQKGAVARSRPSGIWFCWKPLGGRQCPQGHVPGSGRTGPRSHGRHLRVAGLAQSARVHPPLLGKGAVTGPKCTASQQERWDHPASLPTGEALRSFQDSDSLGNHKDSGASVQGAGVSGLAEHLFYSWGSNSCPLSQ